MSSPLVPKQPTNETQISKRETTFPSGRTVQISLDGQEQIQVYSPSGDLEVSLQFTDTGPVLKLSGAKLQLDAAEDIQVRCNTFAVETRDGTDLRSDGDVNIQAGGELRVKTDGATHIDGDMLYLNCEEEKTSEDSKKPESE